MLHAVTCSLELFVINLLNYISKDFKDSKNILNLK